MESTDTQEVLIKTNREDIIKHNFLDKVSSELEPGGAAGHGLTRVIRALRKEVTWQGD